MNAGDYGYDAANQNKGAQPISPMNVNSRPSGQGNSQQHADPDYRENRGGFLSFITCRACR
jgi:hypothetical protein